MNRKWPFLDAPGTMVYTSRNVVEKAQPILFVTRDQFDGSWEFHAGKEVLGSDARIAALSELVFADPSIAELADLQPGWIAIRNSIGSAWERGPVGADCTLADNESNEDRDPFEISFANFSFS